MHGNNSITLSYRDLPSPCVTAYVPDKQQHHYYLITSLLLLTRCSVWLEHMLWQHASLPHKSNYSFHSNGVRWYYFMWKALTFLYLQCHIHVNLMCSLSYIPIRIELVKTWHLRTENGTHMPKDSEKHFTCITIF